MKSCCLPVFRDADGRHQQRTGQVCFLNSSCNHNILINNFITVFFYSGCDIFNKKLYPWCQNLLNSYTTISRINKKRILATLKPGKVIGLFIDEAQKIPKIGTNLKFLVSNISNVAVFVTGSSIFDLHRNIGEPLTGRGTNFNLFPLIQTELQEIYLEFIAWYPLRSHCLSQ